MTEKVEKKELATTLDTTPSLFDRSRSPIMKEITSDPTTVGARVFVANLPPGVTIQDLEDHFSQWGKLVGVTMNKGKFAFVQFETDADARLCVLSGRNSVLLGSRLHIKHAVLDYTPVNPYNAHSNTNTAAAAADASYTNVIAAAAAGLDNYQAKLAEYYEQYYRERAGRGADARSAYDSYGAAKGGESAKMDPLDPNRPNDLEIVLPDKSLRGFGESIEARLKSIGMLVDLLFPPSDISPSHVIRDLIGRRCLYVIFVSPENKNQGSVTVHILHGERQEHRNMPIEDAINLIHHNFDAYVRETRMRNAQQQSVPRDIRNTVLDLLEATPVSGPDLDKLIKYLRDRQSALSSNGMEHKRDPGNQGIAPPPPSNYNMNVAYPGYSYPGQGGTDGSMMQGMNNVTTIDHGANSAAPVGYVGYSNAYGAAPQPNYGAGSQMSREFHY